MEIENKELWKARDLASEDDIIELFDRNMTE